MANIGTDILGLPNATLLTGAEWLPIVQGGTTKKAQAASLNFLTNVFPAGIDYVITATGGPIPTGVSGTGIQVPFDCTITNAIINGNSSAASAAVDIWRCTETQYDGGATHPVVGDSITGGNPLTITAGSKATSTLVGWTTSLSQGSILWYNVNSNSAFTALTIALQVSRSIP